MFYAMNQYYDDVVNRHTVSRQLHEELSVVSIQSCNPAHNSSLCEALDNLGRDVQEEDGGNKGQGEDNNNERVTTFTNDVRQNNG